MSVAETSATSKIEPWPDTILLRKRKWKIVQFANEVISRNTIPSQISIAVFYLIHRPNHPRLALTYAVKGTCAAAWKKEWRLRWRKMLINKYL